MAPSRRAQRHRRAAVGRHDRVGPRERGGAAVVGVRGVPGDLQRQEPGQDRQPDLHGHPPRRRADRARIPVPLPTQIPCAGRPPLRHGVADAGAAAVDRAAVAGIHAEAARCVASRAA